jgi:hypothetical protein
MGLLEVGLRYVDADIKEKYFEPSLNSNKLLLNSLNIFLDLKEIEIETFEY